VADIQSPPASGLLQLDDFSIRALGADDFSVVGPMAASAPHELFELPPTEAAFRALIGELTAKPWSLPFACFRGSEPVGICFMSVAQLKNLNAYLVALFLRPAEATVPLALYIRHAFWSFPLHRLYAQLPALAPVAPHVEALVRVGFKHEGILVAHLMASGKPHDAIAVGLLRDEFNLWCEQNEPRLALG
jgi:RimJ/RimL family protein N-acetyltransferase